MAETLAPCRHGKRSPVKAIDGLSHRKAGALHGCATLGEIVA